MRLSSQSGFTFLEMIIVMVISLTVMGGIYKVYMSLNQTHVTQQQVVQMQQNLRSCLHYIARDIRVAGYDPTEDANAGITNPGANTITFTKDITGGESDGIDNDNDTFVDGADDPTVGAPDESIFSDGAVDDLG